MMLVVAMMTMMKTLKPAMMTVAKLEQLLFLRQRNFPEGSKGQSRCIAKLLS